MAGSNIELASSDQRGRCFCDWNRDRDQIIDIRQIRNKRNSISAVGYKWADFRWYTCRQVWYLFLGFADVFHTFAWFFHD